MSSQQALSLPIKDVDLLYVDGAHDYESVLNDLRTWAPRVASYGVICGDDWLWGNDRPVQRAVQQFAEEKKRTVNAEGNFWRLG